ncbi:P-loop containing nucleoside triphosphate hydrolase protein [Venturia nashicola]|uniref:P-loop containing nucleoside triphosphate hydrolase protein n=1 Tax=Venturia nashicola TaxID=86259 RepID=A0A4Z1P284_9PEZI|nr:P-loop containing nucleoside triphosphate hydrolase protein [Venturia nashicola]
MASNADRSAQLSKFLGSVAFGKSFITSVVRAKQFLEAICIQDDRITCVERLFAKQPSLDALRLALRVDTSANFINQSAAPVLKYLSDPVIKQVSGGQILQEIIVIIADPPTFWNALVNAHKNASLDENATYGFAWLLWELLSIPSYDSITLFDVAKDVTSSKSLLLSSSHETRVLGYKIQHFLKAKESSANTDPDSAGPGGRHDNDFVDFRQIAIYPTSDEFMSIVQPFYRRAQEVTKAEPDDRVGIHLDNQFRLLREDMLAELRDDIQVVLGKKKGRKPPVALRQLTLKGSECGELQKWRPCALQFNCGVGMDKFAKLSSSERKAFLNNNPRELKHQSFGCLFQGEKIVAFAVLDRNETGLLEDIPAVTLQICGDDAVKKLLLALKESDPVDYLQVDTPFFAYEPVLQCLQKMKDLPLSQCLLGTQPDDATQTNLAVKTSLIDELEARGVSFVQQSLEMDKPVSLDQSQMNALVAGLSQPVSLIQGPPGTGKSFVGALLAKFFHQHTSETILVLSYTNHALDQFLEELIDIGIPQQNVVRLGSKSTPRTAPMSLFERQKTSTYTRSRTSWEIINNLSASVEKHRDELAAELKSFKSFGVSFKDILAYLEFSDEDDHFYQAFLVPEEKDGMTRVGKNGKELKTDYLYDRWSRGRGAGIFREHATDYRDIWAMNVESRKEKIKQWTSLLLDEQASKVLTQLQHYNRCQQRLAQVLGERTAHTLNQMRIIGCTTTAAAKYAAELRNAAPGIVLVEEAGEIMESHILTALSPNTKQLILIGDHKQLRPKCNNYSISVEKGDGYDLNRSMFERLVLSEYPHITLSKQHRMCPEISSLIKHLTYPNLQDDDKTLDRPPVLGIQDRVIFFNHDHPEVDAKEIADRRDGGAKTSKSNLFEVELVLKCVRYLAQQGYGTDRLVILTPYLGQLRLLRDQLMIENDPVLNDLDSFDLVRAGLLSTASAKMGKRSINISTIDNYQGAESDIVIVSLTRSNQKGDIGFMCSPERLNVLLSRARLGLIMLGNAQTFLKGRNADQAWTPFLHLIREKGHLYDGLPVQCQQHPDRKLVLRSAREFDVECPDGGCSEPCGTLLNCGLHTCPSKCHQLYDHSKMECLEPMECVCPKKHMSRRPCSKSTAACPICAEEDEQRERIRKRNERLDAERDAKRAAYARQLAENQAEIDHQKRILKDYREADDTAKALDQQKQNIANLKATAENLAKQRQVFSRSRSTSPSKLPAKTNPKGFSADDEDDWSSAKKQWENLKRHDGAENDALDELMDMIGLEDVKDKFLSIKIEVDTAIRQGLKMENKRFGVSLLGNPGTGKTTVARLYAKFLTSVGALPGHCFVETTGAALANEGVSGCKNKLETVQNSGGGALFIDEAYQLASGNNAGGASVLDFVLAEVENLTGKVVFILAGYNKQMEKFFAHNPGYPSRFPHELEFKDYEDDELLKIFVQKTDQRYKNRMKIEDGPGGLFARIVARRVGRGRGREGFGNARDIENTLAKIATRQAVRISKERLKGTIPDDFLFTKADLLGPQPTEALNKSKAWKELQDLIGLSTVKTSIQALFGTVQFNYQRELDEAPLVEYSLNKVFLGSPGTGKTTVAKLYGQVLADIGFLTNGEVVVKNPSDFIGNVIGGSEANTNGILASTVGKVLLIDEAYGLCDSSGEATSHSNIFKTAVIDTIVSKVQSVPGDDRCVLLAGYKEQMEEMFQKVNPGLSRRFPLASAFTFEDFDDEEMEMIFDLKLKKMAFKTTALGKRAAMEVLRRARNRPNFGNAGEVDIILDRAKARQQQRLNEGRGKDPSHFEPMDFDKDFDRGERTDTNIRLLFQGVIGCEAIISKLEGYQTLVRELKKVDMDPRQEIPFNFLFRGPPGKSIRHPFVNYVLTNDRGTGKTSTARKMGKVYYDMGFLSEAEVVECSASDLIGSYVGHTGPKVQKVLENALGRVLFIDEAYRLGDGQFAKEAMDEIVDCLTKPKYSQKLIVILAGYDEEINRLMTQNPGLTSRFPEALIFDGLKPNDCLDLLTHLLKGRQHEIRKKNKDIDLSALESPKPDFKQQVLNLFDTLGKIDYWANARDVQTIGKHIFGSLLKSGAMKEPLVIVTEDDILSGLNFMIDERTKRRDAGSSKTSLGQRQKNAKMQVQTPSAPPPPPVNLSSGSSADSKPNPEHPTRPVDEIVPAPSQTEATRDDGVSDAIWAQLEVDKQAAKQREEEYQQLIKASASAKDNLKALQQGEEIAEATFQQILKQDDDHSKIQEAKRLREEARLQHEQERRTQEELLNEFERQRKAMEEERKKEAKAQQKLRTMGVCPMGFRWIKQANGYRCAGGSHFVTDAQLSL